MIAAIMAVHLMIDLLLTKTFVAVSGPFSATNVLVNSGPGRCTLTTLSTRRPSTVIGRAGRGRRYR